MNEVFQTFNIPASLVATAVKITDALQNGHQGMFQSFFKDGAELGEDGDTPAECHDLAFAEVPLEFVHQLIANRQMVG